MGVQDIAFYVLSVITTASAAMVVTQRNPVHSVLFLILTFFTAAGLFVLLGAEFLAMLLVVVYVGAVAVLFLILTFVTSAGLFVLLGAEFLAMLLVVVYVGAVAVLFLFVVMMLDVDFGDLRSGFARYLPLGMVVAAFLLAEMILVATAVATRGTHIQSGPPTPANVTNTEAIGRVLYTDYGYYFQAAGMILLVAMIGAIVLTLRHRPGVKRQNVGQQVARTVATGMQVHKDVKVGEGITL